jgi:3-deoxy-manno-octulosonate cytidylyltransferase (CMP-KDO synthetase)
MIEQAILPFGSDESLQMTSLRSPIRTEEDLHDPNVVKVVVDCHDFALYFSRAPIPWVRDTGGTAAIAAWRHIGLYGYRRAFLPQFAAMAPTALETLERLEQLRALGHGIKIKVLATSFEAIGVDTPADLARVEALMTAGVESGGSRRAPHSDG